MDPAARKCDECRLPAVSDSQPLLCCKRCKQAWYHDATCQKKHHDRAHKNVCQLKANHLNPALFLFDGLEVIETNVVGRAVFSTKEFEQGSMVIVEPPTMFFNAREGYLLETFDAFLRLSRKDQKKIMDLHQSTLSGRSTFVIEGEYQIFKNNNRLAATYFTLDMAKKLLSIVNENAQRFELKNTVLTASSIKAPKRITFTGIFTASSMVEHSCNPNCSAVIREGLIYCIANKSIASLERISISYLPNVYEKPRHQRHEYLQSVKSFSCQCTRCVSDDECNPINCPFCNEGGVMFQNGMTNQWECFMCGEVRNELDVEVQNQLDLLDGYTKRLNSIQELLQKGDLRTALFQSIEISQTKTIHALSWVHMKAYQYISEAAASKARTLMKRHKKPATDSKVAAMLRSSGLAMLNRVQWMERNISVVRGEMSLETALLQSNCSEPRYQFSNDKDPLEQDVETAIQSITSEPLLSIDDHCLMETFQAAQDLVLSGDTDLAFRLLKRIGNHLKCCVRLSREEHKGLKVFLRSEGGKSPFRNCLLD